MKKECSIVLALYPNSRGLGYACLEMPQKLLDSGVITVRPVCNDKITERIKKFLEFYKPKLLMIRDHQDPSTLRGKRIRSLIQSVAEFAKEKRIPLHSYTRQQIRDVFEQFGATSKYEIAQKIISWLPELASRAPKIRKSWMDEDYNMGIFDALSLAITHEYLNE